MGEGEPTTRLRRELNWSGRWLAERVKNEPLSVTTMTGTAVVWVCQLSGCHRIQIWASSSNHWKFVTHRNDPSPVASTLLGPAVELNVWTHLLVTKAKGQKQYAEVSLLENHLRSGLILSGA